MPNKRRNYRRRRSRNSNNKINNFIFRNTSKVCVTLTAFIIAVFLFVMILMIVTLSYDKVYGGIYLNEVSVSHMTREELYEYIDEKYSKPLNNITIGIKAGDLSWSLNASDLDIKFNKEQIVDAIFTYGHDGNIFQRLSDINSIKTNNKFIDIWNDDNIENKNLVTYNESVVNDLAARIVQEAARQPVQHSVDIKADAVTIKAGNTGYSLDTDKVKSAVLHAVNKFESTSIDIFNPELGLATVLYPNEMDIDACVKQINKSPVNARYERVGKGVQKKAGEYGFSVNRSALEEISGKLLDNPGQTFNVTVEKITPEITLNDLKTPEYTDTLGQYTTTFSAGAQKGRDTNLRLGAQALDGYVILPGEQFSFNTVVGNTTPDKGYQKAPGYTTGGTEMTYGGGICQVSTTLYNAVIRSVDLKVDSRRNHSYTVAYVPKGLDCMISYGSSDFKFTNNTKTPIMLKGIYDSTGKLTFKILGINNNKDISYEFKWVEVSVTKYTTSYTTNPSAKQSGKNGGKYTVTRITKNKGAEIKREEKWSTSTYKAMNAVVLKSSSNTPSTSAPANPQPTATAAP